MWFLPFTFFLLNCVKRKVFCLPYILLLRENQCRGSFRNSFLGPIGSFQFNHHWCLSADEYIFLLLSFSSVSYINNESASCLLRFPSESSISFTHKKWKENLLPWQKVLFLLTLVNVPSASAAFFPNPDEILDFQEAIVSNGCLTSLDAFRMTRKINFYLLSILLLK